MAEHPTVIQALAAVAEDVRSVRKLDTNEHQRFQFRGIDAVLNAVGPAFRAHGVVCIPNVEDLDLDVVTTTGGKASTRALVRVRYQFYGPAGDHLDAVVYGESWDTGDKATAKAFSVAYRTALLQTLTIPTDEPDPDAMSYERAGTPRATSAPIGAPSETLTLDPDVRSELVYLLSLLDEQALKAYNDWRRAHRIPSVKSASITPEQAEAVSAWLTDNAGTPGHE